MPIPGVPSWVGDLDHLNGLDEAALATDTAGQIIFANATARRLYRFLGEDLARLSLASGLLPDEEHHVLARCERDLRCDGRDHRRRAERPILSQHDA